MTTRVDPPLHADEATMLLAFLDYHRATFRAKTYGVDATGQAATVGASTMTLGGLVKHLTVVEQSWFQRVLAGGELGEPWDGVDWKADPDWDWRTGATDPADELFARYDETVARVRAIVEEVVATEGLDASSKRPNRRGDGGPFSLRWILLHMLEEYARHNGHADLLREAVDGTVGE